MIIQKNPMLNRFDEVTADIIKKYGCDAYYAHVCSDASGEGRVPIPIAILQEGESGSEAREWMRIVFLPNASSNMVEGFWRKQLGRDPCS